MASSQAFEVVNMETPSGLKSSITGTGSWCNAISQTDKVLKLKNFHQHIAILHKALFHTIPSREDRIFIYTVQYIN